MKRLWQDLDFRVNSNVKITDKLVKLYVQHVQHEKITIRRIFFGESPKLTDCSLKVLRKTMCHQLTSLELMSNTLISDTEICVFIHTTGLNLKHLNLSDTSVGNRTVRKILTTCSKLETLDLSSCNGVTTEAFDPSDLQCKATGIASINLSGLITPEVFSKLTNYPELKRAALFEHTNNSAASFEKEFNSFTTTCVNLHEFTLVNCSEMPDYWIDDGVTFLCKSRLSKKLEEIDFHGNSNITDKFENYGKFFCQFEIELVLNGCNNVPPDAIDLSRKLLSLNGGKVFYEFRE
nr:14226_t:CDS:2 [Entrophospora candida]